MTTFIFANNVNTTLAGAVSTSATTITLASTANLPASIPSGSVLVVTLNDAATRNNYEIVYATAISGATLTVNRAQEGTAALAWLVGDYAFSGPTAGQQASFGELGANNTWTGNNTFSDPVVVGTATASGDAMQLGQLPGQFASSLSNNGYKKYPDPNSPTGYFIEQWGTGTYPTQLTTTGQNFPIAFPNACLNFVTGLGSAINLTTFTSCGGQPSSLSQFSISVGAPAGGADTIYWTAKGY
jgi:hypothetical protein